MSLFCGMAGDAEAMSAYVAFAIRGWMYYLLGKGKI